MGLERLAGCASGERDVGAGLRRMAFLLLHERHQRSAPFGASTLEHRVHVRRVGHGSQDRNDRDRDHQLDEREARSLYRENSPRAIRTARHGVVALISWKLLICRHDSRPTLSV